MRATQRGRTLDFNATRVLNGRTVVICPEGVQAETTAPRSAATPWVATIAWPGETAICVCLGILMIADAAFMEVMVRHGVGVVNPLLGNARVQLGWPVALVKICIPLVLFACTVFIRNRSGRVPSLLTWTLRLTVIEYAIAVPFVASQVVRWQFF